MRLLGNKTHDYYDSVIGQSAYDVDDIVYNRTVKDIQLTKDEFKKLNIPIFGAGHAWTSSYEKPARFDIITVGFCGKIYPCVRLVDDESRFNLKPIMHHCYSIDDLDKAVRKYGDDVFESYEKPTRKQRQWKSDKWCNCPRYIFKEWFDACAAAPDHSFVFEEHKVPVFAIHDGFMLVDFKSMMSRNMNTYLFLSLNAQLKDIHFQRVFDPFQAYQQINMFLGNMAFPNRPIPHVSDEDMILAKGFNIHSEPIRSRRPVRDENKTRHLPFWSPGHGFSRWQQHLR